jgi:cytochrome c peroxidase
MNVSKTTRIFAAALLMATFAIGTAAAADHAFTGAAKCKTCHNKPADGAQFDQWMSTGHAKAFATLASEQAKAIAKEKGIADPQKADACLKCHVTGHGAKPALLGEKYSQAEGVSCETCHGAGGDYFPMKVMKEITAGKIDGASVGLIKPSKEMCVTCHNPESPTYKPFNYDEAIKLVAHPYPTAK